MTFLRLNTLISLPDIYVNCVIITVPTLYNREAGFERYITLWFLLSLNRVCDTGMNMYGFCMFYIFPDRLKECLNVSAPRKGRREGAVSTAVLSRITSRRGRWTPAYFRYKPSCNYPIQYLRFFYKIRNLIAEMLCMWLDQCCKIFTIWCNFFLYWGSEFVTNKNFLHLVQLVFLFTFPRCNGCIGRGVTKRCRLSWLTKSALVYESICGGKGGVAGSQPMSTAVHRCLNNLWRSNSIFDLCIGRKMP